MKAPIANGTTKPAGPFQPSGAKANPGRKPNQDLTCENLGVVNPPRQDYGKPSPPAGAGNANPSKGSVSSPSK